MSSVRPLLGRQDGEQPDRAVPDHGDGAPGRHPATYRGVPPRAVHVGEGEQPGQAVVVHLLVDAGYGHQRPVGERDPYRLGLPAAGAQLRVVPEAAVLARGLEAGAAELARAVGDRERGDHEVAGLHRRDLGPTSSTTPMNSWPIDEPSGVDGREW